MLMKSPLKILSYQNRWNRSLKPMDFRIFPSFQVKNTPQNSETVFSLFRVNIFRGHVRPLSFFRVMVTGLPFPFPSFVDHHSLRFPSSQIMGFSPFSEYCSPTVISISEYPAPGMSSHFREKIFSKRWKHCHTIVLGDWNNVKSHSVRKRTYRT